MERLRARVSITIDGEECIARLTRQFVRGHGVCQTLVSQAVEGSFKRLINPSIENEFAALSKGRADEEAIKVFTENLRQLLLSPPLGQKRVLALDPGFANGCKIACLDEQGNLLHHEIIYPHPPSNQVRQATEALQRMINTYKIEAIAIGNGTASRESKEFVETSLTPQPPLRRERGREAPSNLPERGGVPMRTREDKGALNLPQHLSKVSASLSPPPSGRSGGALEALGEATLRDILTELEKPGRDPRGEVEVFEFEKNVHTLNDLIVGMELPGIVTNITNFGAFVDIGVHQDGLVHISQLSDRFVTDPAQVIRLHQHVRVRVVEVDMHRKRIGLSMKNIKQ